jgi:hypothetical protein
MKAALPVFLLTTVYVLITKSSSSQGINRR